jgi:prepilin-type N-terminal cleavage/methylation domain-containing protein
MMKFVSQKGFTLIELLVVVNLVAILAGGASILLSEYSDEARCLEIYCVFPQIIRSQKFYRMKHYGYYTANHNELRDYGVDVSEVEYFTYSTFPNEPDSFSIRADASAWAAGGWVLYNHMGDPSWSCDGALIKSNWLPET